MSAPLRVREVPPIGRSAAPSAGERPPSVGGARSWRPDPGWRDLLATRDPDRILEWLIDGDPMALRSLTARQLRADALLLDADRVQLRLLARITHDASVDGDACAPEGTGFAWVRAQVDAAIAEVLEQERGIVSDSSSGDRSSDPSESGPFRSLAVPFGIEGEDLRAACDAFNRRTVTERTAFFALFVSRLELDEAARLEGLRATELARRARSALLAALGAVRLRRERRAAQGRPEEPHSEPVSDTQDVIR
ncbi:MAG: hypothetical protein AAGG01_08715 [Planctomycetota bacterium]